jgi:hypothetical protein
MNVLSEVPRPPLAAVKLYYGKPTEGGCLLTPAPLIDWTVESQFDDSGVRTGDLNRLTLTGTVLVTPSGSYEQMYIKQEELRAAFSVDEKDLVIVAGPGNKTLAEDTVICSGLRPKVISLTIPSDTQFQRIDYTIELEDLVAASGVSGVTSSLTDQWSFQEDPDTCTVNVTHQVSAEGVDGESDKFEQAFRAVKARLGIDKLPLTLPYFVEPNASGLYGFTHPSVAGGGPIFEVSVQREEVADVVNGTYSATETFTIVSGVPFYFTQRTESFEEDGDGIATVTIGGTVQGLGRTLSANEPDGGFGFARACSGFINHVRPQLKWDASGVYAKYKEGSAGSGLALFNPTSFTVTQNKCRGTVDFSATFTDDPSANLPSGIVSATCSVSISEGLNLYASHAIPFRRLGNIVQDIKTTTEGSISIQCQAQAKNTGNATADTNRAIEYVQDQINRLKSVHANPANFVTLRISNLNQQFSDVDLTSTVTLDFAFTVDLVTVPSVNADISLRTL